MHDQGESVVPGTVQEAEVEQVGSTGVRVVLEHEHHPANREPESVAFSLHDLLELVEIDRNLVRSVVQVERAAAATDGPKPIEAQLPVLDLLVLRVLGLRTNQQRRDRRKQPALDQQVVGAF